MGVCVPEVLQLPLHHSQLFPNSEDLSNDCSRAVIFRLLHGVKDTKQGLRRFHRSGERKKVGGRAKLGSSAVQHPLVAFQLSPLSSCCTTDFGSSAFMKTKSRKGSICESFLLSNLTHTLLLGE